MGDSKGIKPPSKELLGARGNAFFAHGRLQASPASDKFAQSAKDVQLLNHTCLGALGPESKAIYILMISKSHKSIALVVGFCCTNFSEGFLTENTEAPSLARWDASYPDSCPACDRWGLDSKAVGAL